MQRRQAFREQLGRAGGHLHGSCRGEAHRQTFLVNGEPQPGRHVLAAGDVVTLVDETGRRDDDAAPRRDAVARPVLQRVEQTPARDRVNADARRAGRIALAALTPRWNRC